MRCSIHLNAEALRHNYRTFKKLSTPSTAIPVIKSNAYGHGLKEIYQILESLKPEWFGVNYLAEAEDLRSFGFKGRILVVGPVRADHVREAGKHKLDIFLSEETLLRSWLSLPAGQRPKAHLKVDTGMSRQGFTLEQLPEILNLLKGQNADLIGICSHFSNVEDVLDQTYANHQMREFASAFAMAEKAGFQLIPHMAASSSALIMKETRLSLTRIGISLYGLWPSRTTQLSYLQTFGELIELKPVLSWKTEVAIVKKVKAGQFIGYGCTYKALRDMTIAVLPVGYYEGYPRIASNRGHVLIRGEQCPIVGRICMNMMMVDISHLQGVQVSDPVTLIGKDGNETIEAAQIGDWAETIHYEIVAQLNPAIPKIIE